MSQTLIATCAFGLEAIVKRELREMGLESRVIQPGWISFSAETAAGNAEAIIRANLGLRTADRVLIQVAEFPAADFDALFETTRSVDWAEFIPAHGRFPVKGRSIQSQLSSVPACQRSVKRAIVESLKAGHRVESLPEDGPTYQIEVALRNDRARLTLDTTGPSLHKRGYRKLAGVAPLKETLAAALVLLSVWNPERPLIDPFCGSGTIPIEAALIGARIAPGLKREFAAESWDCFRHGQWQEIREELRAVADQHAGLPSERLLGTDIDPDVLELARHQAAAAGVGDRIHFQQKSFEELRSKKEYGCVITNPPYGERLKERDLTGFYQTIPRILQRLPTWSHFILTAFPRFEAVIQQSATRRRKLFNGRIECMYYQYLGPKPPAKPDRSPTENSPETAGEPSEKHSGSLEDAAESEVTPVPASPEVHESSEGPLPRDKASAHPAAPEQVPVAPVFGGISARSSEQAELFANRLKKRARHFRRWPKRGITCYRLYERDIPEIPLIVDRYENCLHIVEYERPHDRDLAEQASWQELMCKTAAKTLEVEINNVFFKTRQRQRRRSQHEKLSDRKSEIVVHEGGLQFLVNLSDYADTGLFLDHRLTRQRIREESRDKTVLNLFGYTGSFSVYAAAGGARSVVHIDASRTYVEWAQRNMSINRFHGPRYSFEVVDVNQFFAGLPEKPIFDLVIADPPTFSNSKQTETIWDVQENHLELLREIHARLADAGKVYFSTNFRRFRLDEGVAQLFSEVREISRQTVPEDFRNQRIHRCWELRK